MKSLKAFWQVCERVVTTAVLKEWELEIKDPEVFAIAQQILIPTDRQSTEYPCTEHRPCGCTHELWVHKDGSKVAVCTCDEQECDAIPVTDEDLVIYELDFARIFRGIGKVIGFHSAIREVPGMLGVRCIGECSPSPGFTVPLYFVFHSGYGGMVEVIRQLSFHRSGAFVLFSITPVEFDMKAREAVDRLGILALHLDELIFANDDGTLGVDTRVKDVVSAYLRQATAERSAEKVKAALSESVFWASNDYHTIVLRGEPMPTLTDLQADVAHILHNAIIENHPELSYDVIACKIADLHPDDVGFAPPSKMSQIFRGSDPRGSILTSTSPGFYRLNI
ncbi:MAG: hypothetical protein M1305_08150 [Candidatus Marsarchaeota archaeon]|nr:hypothetical protein [Candidatus Marsarchaeota archaeon]